MFNKRVQNAVLGCNLKNNRMISVCFQGKPFNIMVIQAYAPASNAEEAEAEQFYEDLHDLLELTPQKDVLFIIRDWNAKEGSQETPGITGSVFIGRTDVKAEIQYFGHLIRRADSFEKTLMLGKIEGRRRGHQRMR